MFQDAFTQDDVLAGGLHGQRFRSAGENLVAWRQVLVGRGHEGRHGLDTDDPMAAFDEGFDQTRSRAAAQDHEILRRPQVNHPVKEREESIYPRRVVWARLKHSEIGVEVGVGQGRVTVGKATLGTLGRAHEMLGILTPSARLWWLEILVVTCEQRTRRP